jgi:DNA-binding GntR family transcriptional regulator
VHALPHLTDEHLAELDKLLERLESTARRRDRAGFEAANREFHLLPCRIAGFTRAEQTLHSLLTEWERLHRLAFQCTQPPDMVTANQDHQAIVRAFRDKDAVQLGSLLARHNQTAADHYRQFVPAEE